MNHPDPASDPDPFHGNPPSDLLRGAIGGSPSPTPPTTWQPPDPGEVARLLPQYAISRLIGRRGMGAVYQGVQLSLHRDVAVKLLPPELGASPEFEARFRREAMAMARLNHPNIVQIHDYGQTAEGHHYIVMEYVDGTNLRHLIRGGGLDAVEALRAVSRICDALEYAHGEGFVHRDIKPTNIFISRKGDLKIGDFGLVKLVGDSAGAGLEEGGLTLTDMAMGTPHYVAPEQWQGSNAVDRRADIYSLGVMFYEMLTGSVPQGAFRAPSERVGTLDVRIDGVVYRAMQEHPDDRYQSAADLRMDVDRIRTTPLAEPPAEAVAKQREAGPKGKARSMIAVSVAALVLVAAALAGWWVLREGSTGAPARNELGVAATPPRPAPEVDESVRAPVSAPLPPLSQAPASAETTPDPPATAPDGTASTTPVAPVGAAQADASQARIEPAKEQPPAVAEQRPVSPAPPAISPGSSASEAAPASPLQAEAGPPCLEVVKTQGPNAAEWALSPLDETIPADIRQNLVRLREDLVDEGRKAPQAGLGAYKLAFEYCDKLLAALGQREIARVQAGYRAAQADANKATSNQALDARRNYQMSWPQYSREESQRAALRENEADKADVKKQRLKVEWTTRSGQMRVALDRIYRELREAMREAAPAPLTSDGEASRGMPLPPEFAQRLDSYFAARRQALGDLAGRYAGGLETRLSAAADTGNLLLATAYKEERVRVEALRSSLGEAPQDAASSVRAWPKLPALADGAPDGLVDIRRVWEIERGKLQADLDGKLAQSLQALESELTKARRLEEALVVLAFRESLPDGSAGIPARNESDGPQQATKEQPFVNSLGMKFVPVEGTDVLFCVHETRYKDFAVYAAEKPGIDNAWRSQTIDNCVITERAEDHPAVRVSWEDAQAFCTWLNKKERSMAYRLPTDWEWSIAAGLGNKERRSRNDTPESLSAVEKSEYPWGTAWPPLAGAGNYSDQSRRAKAPSGGDDYLARYDDGFPTTAPAMSFAPNLFGLHDMGGNVWEWVEDWINIAQERRTVRGGSWRNHLEVNLLSSSRDYASPADRHDSLGFRLVLDPSMLQSTAE